MTFDLASFLIGLAIGAGVFAPCIAFMWGMSGKEDDDESMRVERREDF